MNSALINIVTAALEDVKAQHIVTLDVSALSDIMDALVIASGTSNRQVRALAEHVLLAGKKAGHQSIGVEGLDAADWVLVDFGEVVVHVMLPATRAFYELEKFWSLRPGEARPTDP